jgi:hypothetical protein
VVLTAAAWYSSGETIAMRVAMRISSGFLHLYLPPHFRSIVTLASLPVNLNGTS